MARTNGAVPRCWVADAGLHGHSDEGIRLPALRGAKRRVEYQRGGTGGDRAGARSGRLWHIWTTEETLSIRGVSSHSAVIPTAATPLDASRKHPRQGFAQLTRSLASGEETTFVAAKTSSHGRSEF